MSIVCAQPRWLCDWHLVGHLIFCLMWFWKLVRHLALSKALWEGAQDQSEDVRRAAAGQLGRVEACHTASQQITSIIFNLKIQEDRSRVRQNIQTSCSWAQRALQLCRFGTLCKQRLPRGIVGHGCIQRCDLSLLQGSRHPSTDIDFLLGGFRTHGVWSFDGFCLKWAWHAWFSTRLCSEFPCSTTIHYCRT